MRLLFVACWLGVHHTHARLLWNELWHQSPVLSLMIAERWAIGTGVMVDFPGLACGENTCSVILNWKGVSVMASRMPETTTALILSIQEINDGFMIRFLSFIEFSEDIGIRPECKETGARGTFSNRKNLQIHLIYYGNMFISVPDLSGLVMFIVNIWSSLAFPQASTVRTVHSIIVSTPQESRMQNIAPSRDAEQDFVVGMQIVTKAVKGQYSPKEASFLFERGGFR